MRTTATPVETDGQVTAYRLTGRKQWISNGSIADVYTILALAPGGPSWFIVEKGTAGLLRGATRGQARHPAVQHSRAVPRRRGGPGGEPGRRRRGPRTRPGPAGLRLHPGDGRGVRPGRRLGSAGPGDRLLADRGSRAAPRSAEKQGYTHKLIVPHAVRLEAARAFLEETATRIDAGEGAGGALNTEGAIAKYLATEAGNAAAEAAIQAHGGYGYTRPYMVEKIKRDVRITTIYEGTSEILEMTIARDRWQQHLKIAGAYYRDAARAARCRARRRAAVPRPHWRWSAWPGCWRPAGSVG